MRINPIIIIPLAVLAASGVLFFADLSPTSFFGSFFGRGAKTEPPQLGTPLADPHRYDIAVTPNRGLPLGSGSVGEGKLIYAAKCAVCHGSRGQGRTAPELVGGIGTLASAMPEKTVGSYLPYATTLFDYTKRAMPPSAPFSLTDDEVYALVGFVLHLNGLVGERAVLDKDSLTAIEMPNRHGFRQVWQP